ncbi:MAG: UDP-N-acetylmuramate--L-alanine ligase, partial [Clostridia bacterium]|nr:UDP-N-acetylmuramate--L-alanine ligase [Clostridia bacterium]
NVLNAVAAASAAVTVGAGADAVRKGLARFTGAKRRFEILYRGDGITVADDYAHHPSELRATLETAKRLPYGRVIAVFQPFTYSRTVMLMDDFAQVLRLADKVVLSEIMGSREVTTYGVRSADLAAKVDGSVWFSTFEEIADYLARNARAGDLILTLGCGDIYKAAKMTIAKLKER